MTGKPPREGARWGADPTPELSPPAQPPRLPEGYVDLCQRYGEVNVQKVFAIQQKIMYDYPHLRAVQAEKITFAEAVLGHAQQAMEAAAMDGRPHTMPETLELGEKFLGGLLAKNPKWAKVEKFTVVYGDEHLGKAAIEVVSRIKWKIATIIICAMAAIPIFNANNRIMEDSMKITAIFGLIVYYSRDVMIWLRGKL
jgi:hypothetical protein